VIVDIEDPLAPANKPLGKKNYETLLASADPLAETVAVVDEWQTISLNYTLGTTGQSKGVMFHHRGAYLDATAEVISAGLNHQTVYLWTLPMSRANGWCYTWAVTAVAGTHVCLRDRMDVRAIDHAIRTHGVTHMSGKRGFLQLLANAKLPLLPHPVRLDALEDTAQAPYVPALEALGFRIDICYGSIESFGPAALCRWHEDAGHASSSGTLLADPAAHYPTLDRLEVVDPTTLARLPADGKSVGEVVMRGNTLFQGYWKDEEATEAAFAGGVFHTGDLGVLHPDGHLEIRHRARHHQGAEAQAMEADAAACEALLMGHSAIAEAVVLPMGLSQGAGHAPLAAFVTLKEYARNTTAEELLNYCRPHLVDTAVPTAIYIRSDMPRNEDGEVCLYQLKEAL
jgi:fatty-acyl-CoA synthase